MCMKMSVLLSMIYNTAQTWCLISSTCIRTGLCRDWCFTLIHWSDLIDLLKTVSIHHTQLRLHAVEFFFFLASLVAKISQQTAWQITLTFPSLYHTARNLLFLITSARHLLAQWQCYYKLMFLTFKWLSARNKRPFLSGYDVFPWPNITCTEQLVYLSQPPVVCVWVSKRERGS